MDEILLTTDFSPQARKAYPVAVSMARQNDARIHLVHEVERRPLWYRTTEVEICLQDMYDRLRGQLSDEARLPIFAGQRLEEELLREGQPQTGVVEFAHERRPDIVVIATHGRTGLKRLFLGSFAEKIVRYGGIPVLLVRQEGEAQDFAPHNVLVPVDFSEAGSCVLPTARFLAERYGATLNFFKVLDPADYYYYYYGVATREAFDKTLDQTRDVAAAAREQFTVLKERELSGVKAEFQCTRGLPTHEIVCRAESSGADLVLISTHGRSGAKRVLLGSVAAEVVRSAPCSVLVVPERRVLGAPP
jgi:nucleotide-binding universal stress UspA family protein